MADDIYLIEEKLVRNYLNFKNTEENVKELKCSKKYITLHSTNLTFFSITVMFLNNFDSVRKMCNIHQVDNHSAIKT